ncbi:hypothetical protein B0T16DRAFT_456573 [Cercophora newfieldiana]|uniref:Uncharacterized protein n=1 Tax=Cercophora newfieldiana TaxID=92897 RepID=A0AA40CTX4_9PEZI|nr:hypothetical protein B0T16DRAFT_456573 [Cercophora newfieldiana]
MQLSLKPLVLLASVLQFASAAALPRDEVSALACNVNSIQRDLWVENGMSRWRTVFSSSGVDPSTYCQFWHSENCGHNIQCGWDSGVDVGRWRVDASFPRGPAGDDSYWKCIDKTRRLWMQKYGCTTG